MLQVGITGGIGAGKSFICDIFKHLNVPVYNADFHAKKLMVRDHNLVAGIKKKFGNEAYNSIGELDRQYLAKKVFNDPKEVSALNALVHPAVAKDFENWTQKQSSPYVLKEAALLIETGSYKQLDHLILVTADKSKKIRRIALRDPERNESQILAIMDKQISESEAKKYAHSVIQNDGKMPLLENILALHDKLLKLALNSQKVQITKN